MLARRLIAEAARTGPFHQYWHAITNHLSRGRILIAVSVDPNTNLLRVDEARSSSGASVDDWLDAFQESPNSDFVATFHSGRVCFFKDILYNSVRDAPISDPFSQAGDWTGENPIVGPYCVPLPDMFADLSNLIPGTVDLFHKGADDPAELSLPPDVLPPDSDIVALTSDGSRAIAVAFYNTWGFNRWAPGDRINPTPSSGILQINDFRDPSDGEGFLYACPTSPGATEAIPIRISGLNSFFTTAPGSCNVTRSVSLTRCTQSRIGYAAGAAHFIAELTADEYSYDGPVDGNDSLEPHALRGVRTVALVQITLPSGSSTATLTTLAYTRYEGVAQDVIESTGGTGVYPTRRFYYDRSDQLPVDPASFLVPTDSSGIVGWPDQIAATPEGLLCYDQSKDSFFALSLFDGQSSSLFPSPNPGGRTFDGFAGVFPGYGRILGRFGASLDYGVYETSNGAIWSFNPAFNTDASHKHANRFFRYTPLYSY
jgi:hypothetical protein